MSEQLRSFVDDARNKGMSASDITELLVEEGWSRAEIASTLYGEMNVPRPLHPVNLNRSLAGLDNRGNNDPIAVVNNLSTKGFEYSIMFVSLWASAVSLGIVLHQFVNSVFYRTNTKQLLRLWK